MEKDGKPELTYQTLKEALNGTFYSDEKLKRYMMWGASVLPCKVRDALNEVLKKTGCQHQQIQPEAINHVFVKSGGEYIEEYIFDFGTGVPGVGMLIGPTKDGGTRYIVENYVGSNITESIIKLLGVVKKILPCLPEGTVPYVLYHMNDPNVPPGCPVSYVRVEMVYGGDPTNELEKVEELKKKGVDIHIIFGGEEKLREALDFASEDALRKVLSLML